MTATGDAGRGQLIALAGCLAARMTLHAAV